MQQCPRCGKRFLADRVKVCDVDGSSLVPLVLVSSKDRLIGAVIHNRYQIESLLGDGGMGVVYRARDQRTNTLWAVKVLRAEYSDEEDLVNRFQQEAESVAGIKHPNIVRVVEFGSLEDQSRYFVMEYLEGMSLGQLISGQGKVAGSERYNPVAQALNIHVSKQICDGLNAAHALQIVHRDMKPDNVHLVRNGQDNYFVKILDFGIAKVANSKAARTRTGSVFGTPHYMSPEQAQGERDIDQRTDVYALGVLMYQMATGRVPFDADNMMGILTAHLYHQPVRPRTVVPPELLSDGFEAVILKALSKRREARYQSMEALREDLLRVERGQAPLALSDPEVLANRDGTAAPNVPGSPGTNTVPTGRLSSANLGLRAGDAPAAMTGRSIPPVTGSAKLAGSRMPWLAIALGLVGFGALTTAGVIVARKRMAGTAVAAIPARATADVTAGQGTASSSTTRDPRGAADTGSPTIQLMSAPSGAEVSLGGRVVGTTPVPVPRPAAGQTVSYQIVAPNGARATVDVTPETPAAMQVALVLAPAAGGSHSGGGGGGGGRGRNNRSNAGTNNSQPAQSGGGHSDIIDPWAH